MANNRQLIVKSIAKLLRDNLDGNSPYVSNVYDNVYEKQVFWDDVADYPTISVYSGTEIREYQPGGFKWAFLTVNIRIYVENEDAKDEIEQIFEDIELVLDNNDYLTYEGNDLSTDVRILSLSDDEGLLNPLGVGEIVLEVRYEV